MFPTKDTTAILLAGGRGSRMNGSTDDKILVSLNGRAVFSYSVEAFLNSGIVDRFTIVYRDTKQKQLLVAELDRFDFAGITIGWVQGGQERQDSVFNALICQPEHCQRVFIHDCARPLLSVQSILKLRRALNANSAAVLAHPVVDTIKRNAINGCLQNAELEDLDRTRLWGMETPQAFEYKAILTAYESIRSRKLSVTDDTAAVASMGQTVSLILNDAPNPKITTPADLEYVEWLLSKRK